MKDLKRLFGYMGPYRADMALGMLLVVVESAFEMVIPLSMMSLIRMGMTISKALSTTTSSMPRAMSAR